MDRGRLDQDSSFPVALALRQDLLRINLKATLRCTQGVRRVRQRSNAKNRAPDKFVVWICDFSWTASADKGFRRQRLIREHKIVVQYHILTASRSHPGC